LSARVDGAKMRPMPKTRYVALLRGINVGGNNLIKMPALKACFEAQGLDEVVTYIASGNVVFSAAEPKAEKLARLIEDGISQTFSCTTIAVLRSGKQMKDVVARAPKGFGTQPEKYRYDVIFLAPGLTAAAALKRVPLHPEVDVAQAGTGVLYFSRLIAQATKSRLGKIAGTPIYKSLTIRNWNTTSALARLTAS
jgi:uncharacterized protein (DUF1697 family)